MGRKPVGAVVSAIRILQVLARVGRPWRLTELSREAGILPSTCLAILHTLADDGFVMRHAETKTWALGYGPLDLARSVLRNDLTIQLILPQLQVVCDRYDVTTTVWRRVSDADVMFVSVVNGARSIRFEADLGTRTPLMNAAIGRLMALQAGLDVAEVERRFNQIPWRGEIDFERFLHEAREALKSGWGVDRGDFNPRLLSIAVATPTTTGLVDRGVTATMFVDQHSDQVLPKIAADLQEVANHLFRP